MEDEVFLWEITAKVSCGFGDYEHDQLKSFGKTEEEAIDRLVKKGELIGKKYYFTNVSIFHNKENVIDVRKIKKLSHKGFLLKKEEYDNEIKQIKRETTLRDNRAIVGKRFTLWRCPYKRSCPLRKFLGDRMKCNSKKKAGDKEWGCNAYKEFEKLKSN